MDVQSVEMDCEIGPIKNEVGVWLFLLSVFDACRVGICLTSAWKGAKKRAEARSYRGMEYAF